MRPDQSSSGRLDFERLRGRPAVLDRVDTSPIADAGPAMLGRVVSVQTNLKAGLFCKVVPASVLGTEGEGQSGVFADLTMATPVLVYLLGSFTPATGDHLVCRFVDHRWVADTSGGGISHGSGVLLPSCFCMVPATLQMTSFEPNCNYQMFQSCTITYGPPPPAMRSTDSNSYVFTSTSSFVDPLTGSSFFYYFWCRYNQFFLTRIFPTSPLGSPYRDGILYSWVIGGYGNTCTPFALHSGSPYPGSDATCSVTIDGG